jgi:hypothetical protein
VDAVGSLAWIGGVRNSARLPILVVRERSLEVEGVVDVREAELDVETLKVMSAELNDIMIAHLHRDDPCLA